MNLSARQKEIIDISVRLISNQGIQNLTIKNLSKELGISEPAIYRHFENKHEILMTLLKSFEELSSRALIDSESSNLNASDKIEAFIKNRYRLFSDNPEYAKVLFSEGFFQNEQSLSQKVMQIIHQHKEFMEKIIIAGQTNGEIRSDIKPKELFRIIFGSMRLLVNQWCLTGFIFDLESEGDLLWQSVKKMITA